MPEQTWDQDYNTASLSQEALNLVRAEESRRRSEEAQAQIERVRAAAGYITTPFIPSDVVRSSFSRWRDEEDDDWRDGNIALARWTANKMIWVCHSCGMFGYKYSLRETFKCYCCHSRDVQVVRCGEISMALRGIIQGPSAGISMQSIFDRRRERMREIRRARRTNVAR